MNISDNRGKHEVCAENNERLKSDCRAFYYCYVGGTNKKVRKKSQLFLSLTFACDGREGWRVFTSISYWICIGFCVKNGKNG